MPARRAVHAHRNEEKKMSSTDGDDHIRLSNEILESRRRTRLSRAIATIGFAAGAALTGGVATGAWLYFLGFFALITVGVAVGNGISGAVDRGEPIRLVSFVPVLVSAVALGIIIYLVFSGRLSEILTFTTGPIA